jgi:DNA repair protein RadC
MKRKEYFIQKLSLSKVAENELPNESIQLSQDVFDMALNFIDTETIGIYESFYALFLNRANKPVGWAVISTGGVSGTVVDNRILFSHAVLALASSIIVFHNHPSGNLTPSTADIQLTQKIEKAAPLLEMQLLDHIIISSDLQNYYSFRDNGLLQ